MRNTLIFKLLDYPVLESVWRCASWLLLYAFYTVRETASDTTTWLSHLNRTTGPSLSLVHEADIHYLSIITQIVKHESALLFLIVCAACAEHSLGCLAQHVGVPYAPCQVPPLLALVANYIYRSRTAGGCWFGTWGWPLWTPLLICHGWCIPP